MFKKSLDAIVTNALAEDKVFDDKTSDLIIDKNSKITFEIRAREDIIFCGKDVISVVFSNLKKSSKFKNSKINLRYFFADGDFVKAGKTIALGSGNAKMIFAAERVILNLIQHLSGIATLTQKFVRQLSNKKIKILDTRKTLPGLRYIEKHAVLMGGGKNHRFSLSDMILIKDNHIEAAGGVVLAINAAKKSSDKIQIEVECDQVKQVAEAILCAPDIIMLDNMSVDNVKKSIMLIRQAVGKKIKIEISGNVNLRNIKKFSNLDIDFISIGSLTHSVRAVDIGLDVNKIT